MTVIRLGSILPLALCDIRWRRLLDRAVSSQPVLHQSLRRIVSSSMHDVATAGRQGDERPGPAAGRRQRSAVRPDPVASSGVRLRRRTRAAEADIATTTTTTSCRWRRLETTTSRGSSWSATTLKARNSSVVVTHMLAGDVIGVDVTRIETRSTGSTLHAASIAFSTASTLSAVNCSSSSSSSSDGRQASASHQLTATSSVDTPFPSTPPSPPTSLGRLGDVGWQRLACHSRTVDLAVHLGYGVRLSNALSLSVLLTPLINPCQLEVRILRQLTVVHIYFQVKSSFGVIIARVRFNVPLDTLCRSLRGWSSHPITWLEQKPSLPNHAVTRLI